MGNGTYPSRYVPISTALWDPKWFHDNKDATYIYMDKKKVINGVRCDKLAPHECEGLCRGRDKVTNRCMTNDIIDSDLDGNIRCPFLEVYRRQLDKIDFDEFMKDIQSTLKSYEDTFKVVDAVPVFIVYEAPDNQCSERRIIQEWFRDHGVECNEIKFGNNPIRF